MIKVRIYNFLRRLVDRMTPRIMVNLLDGKQPIPSTATVTFPLPEFMEIVRDHWDRHSTNAAGEPIDMNYYFDMQSLTLKRTVNVNCQLDRVDDVLKGRINFA